MLPNACRLQLDEFRSLLMRDRVKHVFASFAPALTTIFLNYATDATDPLLLAHGKTHVMSKSEYMRFANEAHLFNYAPSTLSSPTAASSSTHSEQQAVSLHGGSMNSPVSGVPMHPVEGQEGLQLFSETNLFVIFSKVLRIPDARLTDFEMTYPEFLESLGAICSWKMPDPFIPMQVKLEQFIENILIPQLKTVIRRLNTQQLKTTTTHVPQTPITTLSDELR